MHIILSLGVMYQLWKKYSKELILLQAKKLYGIDH